MFKIWHCVRKANFENICSPYFMSNSDYDRKYREKLTKTNKKEQKTKKTYF